MKIPNISIKTNGKGEMTFVLNKSVRVWLTDRTTMLFIRKGFETTLKIPAWGWVLFQPAKGYLPFIIHGYLYQQHLKTRQKADVELLNWLLRTKPVWKCYVVYFLTRLLSKKHWLNGNQ